MGRDFYWNLAMTRGKDRCVPQMIASATNFALLANDSQFDAPPKLQAEFSGWLNILRLIMTELTFASKDRDENGCKIH